MQKGRVLNLSNLNGVITYLRNNWCYLTLSGMFILGIVAGVFSIHGSDSLYRFFEMATDSFIKLRISGSFLSVFLSSAKFNALCMLLFFIFGTSVTGITLVPVLLGLRGVVFGGLVSVIYSQLSFKGIAFNALILIPPTVISAIFLIISAKEALQMSLQVIHITIPQSAFKNLSGFFSRYCKRFVILLIPLIFSALLDAWVSTKFINIFGL